jgi:chromosome segregation ATPase
MLIVFILILLIGLAGFAFVFTNALKSRNDPEAVPLRPLDRFPSLASVQPAPPLLELSEDEPAQIVELKAICQASELKITKLEQMINEKNKMITDLQKGLESGHDHEVQIDDLKQILQAQIEELKQQNRQLKVDLARSSEENLDLQTKVYAGEASRGGSADHMEVRPEVSTSLADKVAEPVAEKVQELSQKIDGSANSLSLHDVFGAEEEKNS